MGDFNINVNKVVNSDVSKCDCEGIFKNNYLKTSTILLICFETFTLNTCD